jgi:hypothetical protein
MEEIARGKTEAITLQCAKFVSHREGYNPLHGFPFYYGLRVLVISVTSICYKLLFMHCTKCYSCYQIKEDKMGRACGTKGQKRNIYRVVIWKAEGKR